MTRIPSLLFVYVPFVRSGNGYDQSQNVFVVSYVVIAQSTNNSVFIVEQFFFSLIKYHYLEWMKSIFNSQESTIMKKKYLQAKLRVKTRRSWKVNFSRDKIFSKIACVEISVIVHLYICVHECFPIYHVQSSPIPSDFPRKKHAIEWDIYRFVDFTGFTSDRIHPRDLRLDRGVAWSRACPRYRSRDDKRRERERKGIWSGLGKLKKFFF